MTALLVWVDKPTVLCPHCHAWLRYKYVAHYLVVFHPVVTLILRRPIVCQYIGKIFEPPFRTVELKEIPCATSAE